MKRTTISPYQLYTIIEEYTRGLKTSTRGRPRLYSDTLILTIAGIQNLYGFSYRESLDFARWFFTEVPSLADFHYRISCIDIRILEEFLMFLGNKLVAQGYIPEHSMIDGTGWSYHDIYPLYFHRGTEVRMVQSHVRAIVIAGMYKKKRFVLGAIHGKAYEGEVKLGARLLPRMSSIPRGSPFLADKAYDSIAFLELLKAQECIPVVKIKGEHSTYQTIKHPLRIESHKNSSNHDIYAKRTQIEGLFGNVKEKLGSHIRVFRSDIAQRFALIRLALFNISLLVREGFLFLLFRTVSRFLDRIGKE